MARVFELFDLMPEIENKSHALELKSVGAIDFQHVTFEYQKVYLY